MRPQFSELTAGIAGTVTNGWDAICAMDSTEISAVFLQQYLQNGPTNPSEPLQAIGPVAGSESYWMLNTILGPPDVSFPAGIPPDQAQLSMYLVRGELVQFNPQTQTIQSVIEIRPNISQLSGALTLSKASGTTSQLGAVAIALSAGAWTPQIEGVDPGSQLSQGVAQAIQAFFAENQSAYQAGIVAESGVLKPLEPTSFDFYTQPNPNQASDGCLLILISTTGGGGQQQALEPYPIASGYSAALIVSNQILFNQLIPQVLTAEFTNMGATFSGQQGSNGYQAVAGGDGDIDIGALSLNNGTSNPYSSDSNQNPRNIFFPTNGFTVSASGGNLSASWSTNIDQDITYTAVNPASGYPYQCVNTANFDASYSETATPGVDAVTDKVSFTGSGNTSVSETNPPGWWQECFGQADVGGQLTDQMEKALGDVLNGLTLPGVDVFALSNLLFPKGQALSLQTVSLPCDLVINGQINAPVAVTPSSVNLQPGATQQFTASIGGQPSTNVLWEISPAGAGSISAGGLYTAPSSVAQAEAVVITATNNSNTQNVGSAMALVYESAAATGLAISPGQLVLTAGQSYSLQITDGSGNAVKVTCALSPNVGTIAQDFGGSSWIYTAPASISAAQPVVVTATSTANPQLTGTANVTLAPTEAITLNPASATLTANQSVEINAASADLTDYTWMIYPAGTGSIQVTPGNPAQATYTAPANPVDGALVMVAVYSVAGSAGVGVAAITLAAQASGTAGAAANY